MIKNMVLTSFLSKLCLVASLNEYAASIQMLLYDKSKQQLSQLFLLNDINIPSCNIYFLSHRRLHFTMTVIHMNATTLVALKYVQELRALN